MDKKKGRVCVIGAGPSGLNVNVAFKMAQDRGEEIPEIVIFEKQESILGLWNYSWKTGVDDNGEPVHNTMYDHLYINGCKELFEYHYYSYMDHWGRQTPSYPPRPAIRSYLEGRFKKFGEPKWIQLNTVVKNVVYEEDTQQFRVTTRNYAVDKSERTSHFDYIICCTGHFSYPHLPDRPFYNNFTGSIIHAHDQRMFHNYKGKTIMVIGANYSAEDIAQISYKFGAKKIICSYIREPLQWEWPEEFETKTLPTNIEGKKVYFEDGAVIEVDHIIICTGYNLNFPFMDPKIRLESKMMIVPDMLYKSLSLLSNNRVFYLGMQAQPFTYLLTDVQSFYVRDIIQGKIALPEAAAQQQWLQEWKARQSNFKSKLDAARTQCEYMTELMSESDYPKKWDTNETL